jgi:uncharacterized protein (DUF433 family)
MARHSREPTFTALHGTLWRAFVLSTMRSNSTVDPAQRGGRRCIRGMQIRVTDVLERLAAGLAPVAILDELPDLEREDIAAVLKNASRRLEHACSAA